MQSLDFSFDQYTPETPVMTATATENAWRLFTGYLDDCSVTVMCKPVGAADFYPIFSAPHPTAVNDDAPLRHEAGDEFYLRMNVIGDDDRAKATVTFQIFEV